MAEKKVTTSDFSLTSNWTCTVVYLYNSSGSFNSVYSRTQTTPSIGTKTITFSTGLPTSAKILSAKVYATYTTTGWGDGNFKINNTKISSGGSITLDSSSLSSGSVSVTFTWQANKDTSTNHDGQYPGYQGNSSESRTFSHPSTANVTNVYLLVEYQNGSIIYHAENSVLVPYQLFHAENGELVPYQIQHGEGGELVPY